MFSVNYVPPDAPLVYDQTYKGPGASELTSSVDKRTISVSDMRAEKSTFSLEKMALKLCRFHPTLMLLKMTRQYKSNYIHM